MTAEGNALLVRRIVVGLLTILIACVLVFSVALIAQGSLSGFLASPVLWFAEIETSVAFDVISTAAELLAAVLAIAITVVAIIVELAANRYSHRITSLFVHEPINIIVMSFFVIATVDALWLALTLDDNTSGVSVALLFGMTLVSIALLILLPYFEFVMTFLSPTNILRKITRTALRSLAGLNERSAEREKAEFLKAIDEVQDIARRSMEQCDRAIEMASINSLFDLAMAYQSSINSLDIKSAKWFDVSEAVRSDPDFVSIDNDSLKKIGEERLWVEVKILRQYLDLVGDNHQASRDTSYLIAINTRKIAVQSVNDRPDLELTQLCMRCFNSYLRATINQRDARTSYYIMNQYRLLAQDLMHLGEDTMVREIAQHLQFYGLLSFNQGLPFLLEVAAEDVAELVRACDSNHATLLDYLLSVLLELDQKQRQESEEESLLGVRRAQIKLAACLLARGDNERARVICDDLKTEREDRIRQLIDALWAEDRVEYWEFTDRGVNFAYLDPKTRSHLDAILKLVLMNAD
ncbi:MAG: hypothetical protein PsegKO_11060 [Pseudohongiellaceae bacterium]